MSPISSALRPRLAIALGDPGGIGPEVILKALADPTLTQVAEMTVIGSRYQLEQTYAHLRSIAGSTEPLVDPANLAILDLGHDPQIVQGHDHAANGEVSFRSLETAIAQTCAGQFQGIVTGPISKAAWKAAGHDYPGQTELLAAMAQTQRFGMLFVARSPHTDWTLRTLLATTHIPLRRVPEVLNPALLTSKVELLVDCLRQDFGLSAPRIAIAGLNPHSGEQGQLGREEQDWLIPWLHQVQAQHEDWQLTGPVPPDTLWVNPGQAWYGPLRDQPVHDAYLALYHDQGLIPVKLMAFDRAVNVSIGLPFIRTSPDHGTAFDIVGRGIANASSMKAAVQLAIDIVQTRTPNVVPASSQPSVPA